MNDSSKGRATLGRLASWKRKFIVAIAGARWAMRTQNSFYVHLPVGGIVITLAAWLGLETWRWVAILICISMVLALELVNTAIETLVDRLHPEVDPTIGRALDSAAAAVLVASLGAIAVGLLVVGLPLLVRLGLRSPID